MMPDTSTQQTQQRRDEEWKKMPSDAIGAIIGNAAEAELQNFATAHAPATKAIVSDARKELRRRGEGEE